MSKMISSAAGELLALEQIQKTRSLDEIEQDRWDDLVVQIFSEKTTNGKRRRSFRLNPHLKCTIKIRGEVYEGDLIDMSLCGFSFKCKYLRSRDSDFLFNLESVQIQDQNFQIGIECKTVNIMTLRNDEKFGAQITSGNSSETLRVYVDKIYYPVYIFYLESLVTETGACLSLVEI